jgi:protein-S-isoprenylcysteine O-methyltransferase Ste14
MIHTLELKIPPPVVALVVAAAMWAVARAVPVAAVRVPFANGVAMAIAIVALCIAISGVLAFRYAKTTVDPRKPAMTSVLVTSGIYQVTRNPMYLGLSLLLVAWALVTGSALAFLGPLVFVLYITRFQIVPEERALLTNFGADYSAYRAKVRRWL